MTALETHGLGRRYRRRWALHDCTLTIPRGHVVALVGPNGAGKSTLLHLAVGLLGPSTGTVRVLDGPPLRERVDQLCRVGFVGQDKPLYETFRVEEMLHFGAWLNPNWDRAIAEERLQRARVPLDQRVGKLSGGQRAQVALAVALGKRPELLLLDEPVANLDPLARREFLQALMEEVAETGLSVVLSSHLVADLERVCDYLVLLSDGRVQVSGETEDLLNAHARLVGPREGARAISATHTVLHESHTDRQATLLVQLRGPVIDPSWSVCPLTLEDLVLAYMTHPDVISDPRPTISKLSNEVSA